MPKATHKTKRSEVKRLTDIINVGPSIASDLESLGVSSPQKLIGADPLKLYQKLIKSSGHFHDPCVLDCFVAAVDFMNGNKPKVWWAFTKQRKAAYTSAVDKLRS